MTGLNPKPQFWHLSHGIVFAGSDEVVYPRLPLARFHSSPAVLEHDYHADSLVPKPANKLVAQGGSEGESMGRPGRAVDGAESPEAVNAEAANDADQLVEEPPFTPLPFKMPEEVFREAKLAEAGTPESFWCYSMYRGPGADGTNDAKVKVHYCRSRHTTERVLQQYFMDEKVLGFDLEWSASAMRHHGPRQNVALIQLASPSRIALFHVALFPKDDLVAPSLKTLMEDPEITKVGVAIKGDCTRLANYLNIKSRGTFELSHMYKLVKYSPTREFKQINRKLVRLATQAEEHLRLPLFKGPDVRSSDWTQALNMAQIIYSASDAYAALHLYYILDHHRQNLDPVPPRPYHAELNEPIRLADGAMSDSDDVLEDVEDAADVADAGKDGPVLDARYLKSLGDTLNIEGDVDEELIPPRSKIKPRKPSQTLLPKDPKVVEAETWRTQYRESHPNARAAPSSLRAYRIWHVNKDLQPETVAKLLREPPLQTMTVVNYILEAIRLEKLPYDASRLQREVLCLLPKELQAGRYKGITKACEDTLQASTGLDRHST